MEHDLVMMEEFFLACIELADEGFDPGPFSGRIGFYTMESVVVNTSMS